jgi:hypothetical protein
MEKLRLPLLALGMGAALLTAGCHSLRGCSDPAAYSGAPELPRLKIPVGLDGLDTAEALEIPALTQPVVPRDPADKSCLEEPPPMKEAGSNSVPVDEQGAAVADKPKRVRPNTIPVGPRPLPLR